MALAIQDLAVNPQPVTVLGSITFYLTAQATLTVDIRNASGVIVRTLAQGLPFPASSQNFTWDRKDAKGRKVKSGTYSVRVNALGLDNLAIVQAQAFSVQ